MLSKKIAPVQQSFYFVNNGLSADRRYLWFYCAFPPSLKKLGVVDFKSGKIKTFPETQFRGVSPYVDLNTIEVYWAMGKNIWKRGPQENDEVKLVSSLPDDLIDGRPISRMATHLTRSCEGSRFFIDAKIGMEYIFGKLAIDGGDFEYWNSFNRNYNHAQLSPIDAETVLFAQEYHTDPITGLKYPINNRLWMMKKGKTPYPLLNENQRPNRGHLTHEWWDPDGNHVWSVCDNQTWKVNINDNKVVEKIKFPQHCWHSHSSKEGDYIVCDSNDKFYRGCASSLLFLNRKTDKVVKIIDNPEKHDYTGRNYHIDPHPRFCGNNKYIIFTTTIKKQVDLTIVEVEELIDKIQ